MAAAMRRSRRSRRRAATGPAPYPRGVERRNRSKQALVLALATIGSGSAFPALAVAGDGLLLHRDTLTGDWGESRTGLADHGILLGADSIDDAFANLSGGVRAGTTYEGRFEVLATLDLERLMGWQGAIVHANAYQIHGRGLSSRSLGNNLLTVTNIEATTATRLFDLWIEQTFFKGRLSLRIGQIAADDEFFVSPSAANFVNSTFGWPDILSSSLPSGGPVYPLATPGVRLKYAVNNRLTFSAAAFSGDPAGPGTGDPQRRNHTGTAFRLNDGTFVIAEAAYGINQSSDAPGLPASFKLGVWFHSGSFADQRFDRQGLPLASPLSTGLPETHRRDAGAYLIVDQTVWRRKGTSDQGLAFFFRMSGAPSNRNKIALYGDAGVSFKGITPHRPDDVCGVAFAFAKIGKSAVARDRDLIDLTGEPRSIRSYEAALELTYRAQVTPWWALQPDVQIIFRPGAGVGLPDDPAKSIPTATVFGVRSSVIF